MITCFYQGIEGSYSHIASQKFGRSLNPMGKKTFQEVFLADYGVVALENSLIGSIHENYDLLREYGHYIVAESYLKIDHCLLGHTKDLSRIKRVYSHPKALEQCQAFLDRHQEIEKVACYDTAGAAFEIAQRAHPEEAAIASIEAGRLYGLLPIVQKIQDFEDNYTRFVLISKAKERVEEANKCTLMLPLEVGALAAVLQTFSALNLKLTKIEARPLKNKPFESLFYLDLEYQDDQWLSTLPGNCKVLGTYKKGSLCD